MSPPDLALLLSLSRGRTRRKTRVGTKPLVAVDVEREGRETLVRRRKSYLVSELWMGPCEGREGREGKVVGGRRDGRVSPL